MKTLTLIALGAFVSVVISWTLAGLIDPRHGVKQTAESYGSHGAWTVQRHDGQCSVYVLSSRMRKRDWGPEQACGPPDTAAPGDRTTAWASLSADGQPEWLLVGFAQPVAATSIVIHETYNPGAIVRITAVASDGTERVLWEGGPAPIASVPARVISIAPSVPIDCVKLYLDSPAVSGWNEIDAVALCSSSSAETSLDPNLSESRSESDMHWAVSAEASSTYADRQSSRGDPRALAPSWSDLHEPSREFDQGRSATEERWAAAFGWPMLAMSARGTGLNATSAPRPFFPPLRPVWGGLLIDSALYVGFLALLSFVFMKPLRAFKGMIRMQRGACPRCGYDLRFDFARGCPECGLVQGKHQS